MLVARTGSGTNALMNKHGRDNHNIVPKDLDKQFVVPKSTKRNVILCKKKCFTLEN